MEQQGWVKFYREWLDNPIITKDSEHMAVWIYLNCSATHIEKDVIFNGKKITLRRGQMIVSCKEIYEKLKIERNKMDRIIKLFKNEELIEQQTRNHKSLITLSQWDFYQGFNEEQNEELIRNQRGTKQETENEKEKRSKREKDKEKEINKNEKNERISIHSRQQSADSRQQKDDFSFPSEKDLDRWLNQGTGDRGQEIGNEADSFALANPIQQEKKERIIPQPQTPSPFAAGEHLPQATSQPPLTVKGGEPRSGGGFAEATPQLHCEALHLNKVQHHSEKDLEEFFGLFWQAYPKKIGKGYAFECFKKIRVSRSLLDTMLEAIAKQKKSDMWKRDKGQYIPNPSTWLNQKRWEDDLGGETEEKPRLRLGTYL